MVAVYPTSLIVLVDNPNSAAVNTVYIVEEADLLSKSYNKDLDASYSTVFSTVDGDATLYVFAAGAQAGEGDLVINGNTVSNVWSGTSSSFDTYMTDVDAGDIAVDFVSTGSTILALHQMVVVQNIRKSTTLDANDLVMTYDDGSSWNVTLTDGEGNAIEGVVVKISTPNEIYNLVTDANGTVSLPINLDSGSYEFNASFDGNNDYISSSVNAVITVNKVDSTLNVDGFEFTYGGVGSTVVSFTGATGVVAEIVNQSSAVVSVDGETITVSGLTPGSYDLAVTTIPDDNHNAVTETVAVTVNKADPLLTISYDADANEVVATLTNANGKALVTANVIVSLNGENQTLKTNSKGQVKVSTENLTQGSYVASVSYKGNSKFNPSNASMVINVRLASCVSLVYDDDANELVGTLTNGEGKALVTANVIVNLNGVDYALKTNSKGQVKVSAENLTYGIYPASISYKGNAKYNPSSASIVVNTKLNPCITLDYNDDAKELVVTLTNAEGKALVTANVIVNIDGVDYALKTNSKGKAKLSTADFAPGNYTASVTYKGNSKYNPASATEEIAVQ
jgi:hypothetical protein